MKHNCKECLYYNNFISLGLNTCDEKPFMVLNSSFPFIKTNCSKFREITFGKESSRVSLLRCCSVFAISPVKVSECSRTIS